MKINFILIPHAGKKYAGDCRKSVLDKFRQKKIKNIIYITALHNSLFLDDNLKNKNFIIEDECKLFNKKFNKKFNKNFIELKNLDKNIKNNILKEHSYKWVKNELNFMKAKHTIITPGPNIDLNEYLTIKKLIEDLVKKNKNKVISNEEILIIGTTDLIHYGFKFNFTKFKYPQQTQKLYEESKFIKAINDIKIDKVKKIYEQKKHICCGINSILVLLFLIKNFDKNLKGHVYNYYDSDQSKYKDVRRYSNNFSNNFNIKNNSFKSVKSFVSYVSILFEKDNKDNKEIKTIDKNIAKGCLRNIVLKNYYKKYGKLDIDRVDDKEQYYIPIWSNLYRIYNGVFVGISLNNKVKCSTGRFQVDKTNLRNKISLAKKIYLSSNNCLNDSFSRWGGIKNEDIENLDYKIELLESNKKWKKTGYSILIKNSKNYKNKNYGFHLKLTLNNKNYSATYLPNVWEKSFPANTTIIKMLNKLATKATNIENFDLQKQKNIYDNLEIKIYKTEIF